MKKIRVWLIVVGALCFLCRFQSQAQAPVQAKEPPPGTVTPVTRVIEVKYVDPTDLRTVLEPFIVTSGRIVPNRQLKTLTLSGSPDIVAAMEAVVRKLDVAPPPPRNLELTAYLLSASEASNSTATLPPALDPVLKQLRSIFAYRSYQLLDTIVMRSLAYGFRAGANTSGFVPHPANPERRVPYQLRYGAAVLTHDERGDTVHLEGLALNFEFTLGAETREGKVNTRTGNSGLSTNIDIRVGQMVVVGKTNFEVGDNALIAVLSAKVVD